MSESQTAETTDAQDENADVFSEPIKPGETVFQWVDDGGLVWVHNVFITEDGRTELRIADSKDEGERTITKEDLISKVASGDLTRSI
jgi:hypothetical protein